MLKISRPSEPRSVVLDSDPSLDATDEKAFQVAWTRYLERYDMDELATIVRPGSSPTKFIVGPLTQRQLRHVENVRYSSGQIRTGDYACELLAYAVWNVVDAAKDEAGSPFVLERSPSDLGPRLPDDVLYWILSDPSRRLQLQDAAQRILRLDPEAAKSRSRPLVDARP